MYKSIITSMRKYLLLIRALHYIQHSTQNLLKIIHSNIIEKVV